jgi:hypothetical protein
MQHLDSVIRIATAGICAALMFGCSAPRSDPSGSAAAVVAPYPPPPKRAEIPPPPSSSGLLWLVGHWGWDGAKYTWTSGHYVRRPTPTANWLPGYWGQEPSGWLWTEGHWES